MILNIEELITSLEAGTTKIDVGGHCTPKKDFLYFVRGFLSGLRFRRQGIEGMGCTSSWTDCYYCGESYHMELSDDDKSITIRNDIDQVRECPNPNIMNEEFHVELDCPSGQFVLFNDLRCNTKGEEIFKRSGASVNSLGGQKKDTECYAKQGLGMICVGNSCPSVRQLSKTKLQVGCFRRESKKKIGGICTDLWWYSIIDKDLFQQKFEMTTEEYQAWYESTGAWPELVIANVKPGKYKISSRGHLIDEDKNGDEIFSVVERIE